MRCFVEENNNQSGKKKIKARVETIEKWMADMHDKEEGNNCQGGAGGTLDIQEFDSMQLFQEAQKVNQIRAQFKTEIAQMKQEIMDKSKMTWRWLRSS